MTNLKKALQELKISKIKRIYNYLNYRGVKVNDIESVTIEHSDVSHLDYLSFNLKENHKCYFDIYQVALYWVK